ncbi:hypothetical protein BKA62DRAFT_203538 [Auriculariales sp. MPI-PUGE-AT-0066]|nr:hypothetical protein BKA62DRAFT_203538 [Auriculariales sp. MPI-PUGE-AT-0066]
MPVRRQEQVTPPPPTAEPSKGNLAGIVVPAILIPVAVIAVAAGAYLVYRQRRMARRRREVQELTTRSFSQFMSYKKGHMQSDSLHSAAMPIVVIPSPPQPAQPVMTLEIRRPVSYATTIGDSGIPVGVESVAPSSPASRAFTFPEPQTPQRNSIAVSTVAASSRPTSTDSRFYASPSSLQIPPVPALPRSYTHQFSATADGQEYDGDDGLEYSGDGENPPRLRALSPISTFGGTTLHGHARMSTDSAYAIAWTPGGGAADAPPVPPLPNMHGRSPLDPDDLVKSPAGTFGGLPDSIIGHEILPISRASGSSGSTSRSPGLSRSASASTSAHATPPLPPLPSGSTSRLSLPPPSERTPMEYARTPRSELRGPRLSMDQAQQEPPPPRPPSPSHILPRLTVDTVSASASRTQVHAPVVVTAGPSPAPSSSTAVATPGHHRSNSAPQVFALGDEYELPMMAMSDDDHAPMTALSPPPGIPQKPKKRRTLLMERRERRLRLALADKAVAAASTPMESLPEDETAPLAPSPGRQSSPSSAGRHSPSIIGRISPHLPPPGHTPQTSRVGPYTPMADTASRYSQSSRSTTY